MLALTVMLINLIATTAFSLLIGETLCLRINRNALTCLVSAFHLQANNIVPSSAKTQGQRRAKSDAIAITLPAQNEALSGRIDSLASTRADADHWLSNFGSAEKGEHWKL